MGNFYTIHTASKMLGVTPQTLRNWDRDGKLKPHHTSSNGYRYYSQEQQELVEDLVQIIAVFSCKLHGKRANKARKIVKELLGDDTDD